MSDTSKVAFVMDYLSSFPLTLLSIMGGGMTSYCGFGYWKTNE